MSVCAFIKVEFGGRLSYGPLEGDAWYVRETGYSGDGPDCWFFMAPSSMVSEFFHGGGEGYTELKRLTATTFEERMRQERLHFTLASREMESA